MTQNQPNPKKNNSGLENFSKYSGIAFQMIAIILVFVWAGKKIDDKYSNGESVFIIIFSLLGVGIAMYVVIKDIINISREK